MQCFSYFPILSRETRLGPGELLLPNLNLDEDLVSRYLTPDLVETVMEECGDVLDRLQYSSL